LCGEVQERLSRPARGQAPDILPFVKIFCRLASASPFGRRYLMTK
jgi:hypothetical protein